MVDAGTDPREEERQAEAAALAEQAAQVAKQEAADKAAADRQRYTLKALCNEYVAMLTAKDKDKSAGATRSSFKCHVFTHPEIAALPANAVTSHQIAMLVRKVVEAGKDRAAGTLRSYLNAAYSAARRAPFDAKLPSAMIAFGIEVNPVEPIATIEVKRGTRTLTREELKTYMASLGPELQDQALRLALYAGGQRMSQLLRATVADYDAETKTLRLYDPKGRRTSPREHALPLGPTAAAMVAELVKRAEKTGSQFLFSAHGKVATTATTPGNRLAEIAVTMGGSPFDLRDIRRTCETQLAAMGISRDTRAQLLSHGLSGVQSSNYDMHSYTEEKRAALVAWEARLDAIAKGEQPISNVVPMPGAAQGQ